MSDDDLREAAQAGNELADFLQRIAPRFGGWQREHNRWVGPWRIDRAEMLARRAARHALRARPELGRE